jgi:hypothetical protein
MANLKTMIKTNTMETIYITTANGGCTTVSICTTYQE